MTAPADRTDTPIYDGVLGDRLAAARASVQLAQRDAEEFRAGLTRSAADALEQQAEQRARVLVAERTADQAAYLAGLERRLRVTEQALARADDQLAELRGQPAPVVPAMVVPVVVVPVVVAPVVVAPTPEVVSAPDHVMPGRVTVLRRTSSHDDGPAAADVPAVPSMKDIFATTRAAGWLDNLNLGGRPA